MECKVEHVNISKGGVNSEGRAVITFTSMDNVRPGEKFQMVVDEKSHYFNVIEVETGKNINGFPSLKVKASEVGYYYRFDKSSIDIRKLLDQRIEKVTDETLLKQIAEESRYL